MKLIMTLSIALYSTFAMANGFELVKDGVTYSCEEKVNSNPNAVVACINAAKGYPAYFDQAQSINLCTGAKSNAPVDCVNSAIGYPSYLSKDQAIQLCKQANNNGPVDCVNAGLGYPAYFNKSQAIELCLGAKDKSPVDCVNSAIGYPSYLSKDQALQICKAGKVFSVGGVEFVQKFDFLKSLNTFKNQLKSSK